MLNSNQGRDGGRRRASSTGVPHVIAVNGVRISRGGSANPLLARFGLWRRGRPFWGGLWCVAGGAAIAAGPLTAIKVILIAGSSVWLGIFMGVLVAAMGLFLWFAPQLRALTGILAVLFSVVSLLTSDYGGFGVGLLLGTVGGAMGFAWAPVRREAETR